MPLMVLTRVLSPWTDPGWLQARLESMRGDAGGWEAMYALATAQWCAPLLYEVLRRSECLPLVPEPVLGQLRSDCLENRLRNQLLKDELVELLRQFGGAGIGTVLLKGAATFADDLYGAIGGRAMLDLDLLIRQGQIEAARAILAQQGYVEIPDEGKALTGLPTDQRHAHINGYRKPGTPLLVELHYNIAYGQGGRILPAETGWRQTVVADIDGMSALMLDPTYRLLHDTVHGLIPFRDYIRGEIRLWHLLEFAWLAHRYQGAFDWAAWLGAAKQERYTTAFLAWMLLAHEVLAMPLPDGLTIGCWPRVQARRLQSATLENRGQNSFRQETRKQGSSLFVRLLHRGYYFVHLPGWVWRNVCYADGWQALPARVWYLFVRLWTRRSWEKI